MKKILMIAVTLSLSTILFADDTMNSNDPFEASSPQCETIATACKNAGFTKDGGKGFWHDCMKPVLFGKTVQGVAVDKKDIQACRKFKIQNLQKQLNEYKKLKN